MQQNTFISVINDKIKRQIDNLYSIENLVKVIFIDIIKIRFGKL